jgi:hypothetical protein
VFGAIERWLAIDPDELKSRGGAHELKAARQLAAYYMMQLGMTATAVAAVFNVHRNTINVWYAAYVECLQLAGSATINDTHNTIQELKAIRAERLGGETASANPLGMQVTRAGRLGGRNTTGTAPTVNVASQISFSSPGRSTATPPLLM